MQPPSDPVTLAIEDQRRRILALRDEIKAALARNAPYEELRRLQRRLEREEYFGD